MATYTKSATITWQDEFGAQSFSLGVDALNSAESYRQSGAVKQEDGTIPASVVEMIRWELNRQTIAPAMQAFKPSAVQTAWDNYVAALKSAIDTQGIVPTPV